MYAPNYKDGETVALIRYPHGGTFEIPILKVNNKLAEGKSVLGNTPADAIGINKKNADRLSGADFDGDTVMVIPCNSTKSKVKITSTSPLKGLEGFDTKDAYGGTVKKDADGVDHYYRTEGSLQNTTGSKANRMKLASTKKGIENFLTGSLLEIRPMRIDKLQGLQLKVATVDEWLSGDIREDVIGAIEQGASKVNDYLIVAISSEGTVRNGAGDTIKMELMDILKGDYINPHVSIWWYKLDSIDEVADPDKWLKANPNLGKTVSYETYQLDVERAEKAPAARNDILAKRFGLPMEGYTYYFTYEETLPHRHRDYWQMPCSLGADLSQGDDFCAFTFLFPLSNGSFGIKTRNYISSSTLMKLPAAMRIKYDQFMKEGSLIVLEGTVLDMMEVYEDLDNHIIECGYDVRCFGYDPYNAKEFVERWASENGPFGIEKVIQGAKTESVPLGELKKLSEERMLLFDEDLMTFAMGNCITLEDTNGNRKLLKKRYEQKIDAVAAMMDAYIAFKANREAFE